MKEFLLFILQLVIVLALWTGAALIGLLAYPNGGNIVGLILGILVTNTILSRLES